MNRFNFDFDTSVLALDGNFYRVLVEVYAQDDFELWNPDLGIPVDIASLPQIDQVKIYEIIAERSDRRADAGVAFEVLADLAWDIREMNKSRGVS